MSVNECIMLEFRPWGMLVRLASHVALFSSNQRVHSR